MKLDVGDVPLLRVVPQIPTCIVGFISVAMANHISFRPRTNEMSGYKRLHTDCVSLSCGR